MAPLWSCQLFCTKGGTFRNFKTNPLNLGIFDSSYQGLLLEGPGKGCTEEVQTILNRDIERERYEGFVIPSWKVWEFFLAVSFWMVFELSSNHTTGWYRAEARSYFKFHKSRGEEFLLTFNFKCLRGRYFFLNPELLVDRPRAVSVTKFFRSPVEISKQKKTRGPVSESSKIWYDRLNKLWQKTADPYPDYSKISHCPII